MWVGVRRQGLQMGAESSSASGVFASMGSSPAHQVEQTGIIASNKGLPWSLKWYVWSGSYSYQVAFENDSISHHVLYFYPHILTNSKYHEWLNSQYDTGKYHTAYTSVKLLACEFLEDIVFVDLLNLAASTNIIDKWVSRSQGMVKWLHAMCLLTSVSSVSFLEPIP